MSGVNASSGMLVAVAALVISSNAWTQDYPTRPLRLVTPYAAGAGTDDTARLMSAKLAEQLKQPVIVDNKGGAGGLIATQDVLRSQPMGYSLLMGAPVIVTNLFAYRNPGYKWEDFRTIGVMGVANYGMIMHNSVPAKTIPEFVAYARANPNKLNYGSVGPGYATILTERFKEAAGIKMEQVLFKGGAPLAISLLAGEIHVYIVNVSAVKLRLQNPQMVGLAVTGEQRTRILPDLPTFKELGYPTLAGLTYFDSILVPAAASRPIIQRLQAAMSQINTSSDMKSRLEKLERDPWPGTPEEFDAYIKRDADMLAADFKKLNIQPLD